MFEWPVSAFAGMNVRDGSYIGVTGGHAARISLSMR